MSVCPKTSGRNFTIPCLISIPQRAYHSVGMQSSCHLKIQTENISYSALNDITDSEEMAELPDQIIIAFNLPNTQQRASVNLVTCCLWKIKWQWSHLWQWNPYNILFFPTQVFQIKNKLKLLCDRPKKKVSLFFSKSIITSEIVFSRMTWTFTYLLFWIAIYIVFLPSIGICIYQLLVRAFCILYLITLCYT